MPNILVATLGTWQLIPEVIGFTNPGLVDLYRHHPAADEIRRSRDGAGIEDVDEVWMVTTGGSHAEENLCSLFEWYSLLPASPVRPKVRVWRVSGVEDLSSAWECRVMGEALFRLCQAASAYVGGGRCYHSLAGGRKTMSSDLQRAASVFGSDGLLHVIQNGKLSSLMSKWGAEMFSRPFPAEVGGAVTPVVLGRYERNPMLDVEDLHLGGELLCIDPTTMPEGESAQDLIVEDDTVTREIECRVENSSFLLCNYTVRMRDEERSPAFMALYGLSPRIIQEMKSARIGVDPGRRELELRWLLRLPKAELHCHLGGIADAQELVEIAGANAEAIDRYRTDLGPWLDSWRRRLDRGGLFPKDLKRLRKGVPGVPEPVCVSSFLLLFRDDPGALDRFLYGRLVDEESFFGIDFKAYEKLGDLQGSGLLQSKESLQAACRILAGKAVEHNGALSRGALLSRQLCAVVASQPRMLRASWTRRWGRVRDSGHSLVFIASRHGKMSAVREHVELACKMMDAPGGFPFLRGFDVAGDESARAASRMRAALIPLMERCIHLTIHAGEKQPVESVWEAVYHLNAERIGHGLTLKDNPTLMHKFKDRGIAVEMCPSSNAQIVGYRDNYFPSTNRLPLYPLQEYLDAGLRVCRRNRQSRNIPHRPDERASPGRKAHTGRFESLGHSRARP